MGLRVTFSEYEPWYNSNSIFSFRLLYEIFFDIMESNNMFEIYMQELKIFQANHPRAFKDKPVLPESSFSQLSSRERKELSTIYFNLAKAIIDAPEEGNQLQALDYLIASTNLDATCNKGAYSMIAKIYVTNKNQIGAYANVLIAVELGEITREDELFTQVAQQCKRMSFPTKIQSNISYSSIDNYLDEDSVLILKPGTYHTTNFILIDKTNIMIIGIGEVTIRKTDLKIFAESDLFKNLLVGIDSKLVLYNIRVESTQGHSLYFNSSKAFIDNCQFTKCSGSAVPICVFGCKAQLFMNKCIVANSRNAGGILLDNDSEGIIKNCEIYNIGLCAIEVRYGSSLHAEKNNIHHNDIAVLAWLDTNKVKLIDNVIHDNREEGILVHGNRESALSKKFNKLIPLVETTADIPPPGSSYTKPSQTVAVLEKNQILKNGSFGISAEFQANVQMKENNITANGDSGCIIKGGVDASLLNNIIHNNGSYGIEIGYNYQGKVVVEKNHVHSNKKENILLRTTVKSMARELGVDMQQLYTPVKMVNNKIGSYGSDEQDFVDFNVSSNRPGMHLFYEEEPYLYAVGNTYGFNLLKDLKSYMTVSEVLTAKTISYNAQKTEISVFLGGVGDLRNIVETVHGLTTSLENHTENCNVNILFTINDFNPTVLTRDLVLLEMISRLPDPKQPSINNEGLYNQWNKKIVVGVMQILSVWAEKTININTNNTISTCIHSLIESLENYVNSSTNKNYDTQKLPPWISFKYSPSTASSILQVLKCWKDKLNVSATLNRNAMQLESLKSKNIPETERLESLMKEYSYINEDINKYTCCHLPISNQAQSCDIENKKIYSGSRCNNFNITMLTVPTMEDNVYPTSCIFRAFHVTDLPQYEIKSLTLYDHLLLTLLPKFVSLRASLCRTSSIQMQVIPILGDFIDVLLCQLPSSVRFNAVDCSNLADYVSLINILLTAAPRLKENSSLTLQLMKLYEPPAEPMKEFVERRLGISLNVLERLTGIIFIYAYYQDYAVYVIWNFNKTKGKEKKSDKLMTDVISVARTACRAHTDRIKGLSINVLVRLFQIMIVRFSKETMLQLLQSLFSSEGFKKYIPNFSMHLIELKVFMALHLSQSVIFELKEFKNVLPIVRYTVRWKTDKIEKAQLFSSKWIDNKLLGEKKMDSESEIWLQLNKPISNSNSVKSKEKSNNNNSITSDQEPPCYYFDSVSLNATKAPIMTISFHLPVPFYNTHKDWILECNVGSVKILPAATKLTLSKASEEGSNHDIWVDVLKTEEEDLCRQCEKTRKRSTGAGFCGKCKLVFYCSIDCQTKDWNRHKKECIKA